MTSILEKLPGDLSSQSSRMASGKVVKLLGKGMYQVKMDASDSISDCGLLSTGGDQLELFAGDQVLVWSAGSAEGVHVILGRVGESNGPLEPVEEEVPSELVLEATERISLRCGDGSITVAGDGKVVIRGKQLLSRATQTNRIKGGSVAIN